MKMLELKRERNFECGFINPDKLHQETIDNVLYNKDIPDILLNYFKQYRDKKAIFWAYNFKWEITVLYTFYFAHLMLSFN